MHKLTLKGRKLQIEARNGMRSKIQLVPAKAEDSLVAHIVAKVLESRKHAGEISGHGNDHVELVPVRTSGVQARN